MQTSKGKALVSLFGSCCLGTYEMLINYKDMLLYIYQIYISYITVIFHIP